ncbi:Pyoverdin chromophore biosynthetic protein pvcC [Caballeronia jiangsuensis]|nr:Pyoverdin chromophore biosynthetic protein pvcC [Caballeronia jiangsuensis]
MNELSRHLAARPLTGRAFIDSLQDGREVFFDGERIDGIATHPAFRNSARSLARLYDALHDPAQQPGLTCATDTGNGGYTHCYFRHARNADDLVAQQQAIAAWARLTYGWMGRTPDYKASIMNTLNVNADYYGPFAGNARQWHKLAQETVPFMNHALANPPIDRARPEKAQDVYIHIDEETDGGLVISGAKVVATSAAFTHYTFLSHHAGIAKSDKSRAVMFFTPMNAPGLKLICRNSYEYQATQVSSPFDSPLSSRFDENDAILILDRVFVPWENVLSHGTDAMPPDFPTASGFMHGTSFHGCTRYAVKLDFLTGLLSKALHVTSGDEFRGNQVMLGEVIALRHMFWSLANTMARQPDRWIDGAVLPNLHAALAYRALAPDSYGRIKEIVHKIVASALIYLPSSTRDFDNPDIDRYLSRYVRGSNGIGHRERIKLMKLMWDAVGTEFAGRHELYERNYMGSHEEVKVHLQAMASADGSLKQMTDLVDQCLADYDEHGWVNPVWKTP